MTKLMEKAFEEASHLPPEDQDALAQWLLEELKADRKWAELLSGSEDFLGQLAERARAEHRGGRSEALDPERL